MTTASIKGNYQNIFIAKSNAESNTKFSVGLR